MSQEAPQETAAAKPINVSKIEQDMSAAPFFGLHKIEYEEAYESFEEQMAATEKDKSLNWMDFFGVAAELEEHIIEGSLIIVETKKYKCLFTSKPGYHSRKFKSNGKDFPTTFYTWQQVIDLLKEWKTKKFRYDHKVDNPDQFCVNRNFRHVHVFKHKKGFLLANQFDMTYPEFIMKSCIHFPK